MWRQAMLSMWAPVAYHLLVAVIVVAHCLLWVQLKYKSIHPSVGTASWCLLHISTLYEEERLVDDWAFILHARHQIHHKNCRQVDWWFWSSYNKIFSAMRIAEENPHSDLQKVFIIFTSQSSFLFPVTDFTFIRILKEKMEMDGIKKHYWDVCFSLDPFKQIDKNICNFHLPSFSFIFHIPNSKE